MCPASSKTSGARNAELTAAWTTAVLNRSKSCGSFSRFWSSMYNNMLSSASDSGIHVTDWLPACCNPATLARILQGVFVLQNVNVAKLLPVLQFFAFCETQFLNLSACFCAMLTIQNVK